MNRFYFLEHLWIDSFLITLNTTQSDMGSALDLFVIYSFEAHIEGIERYIIQQYIRGTTGLWVIQIGNHHELSWFRPHFWTTDPIRLQTPPLARLEARCGLSHAVAASAGTGSLHRWRGRMMEEKSWIQTSSDPKFRVPCFSRERLSAGFFQ